MFLARLLLLILLRVRLTLRRVRSIRQALRSTRPRAQPTRRRRLEELPAIRQPTGDLIEFYRFIFALDNITIHSFGLILIF